MCPRITHLTQAHTQATEASGRSLKQQIRAGALPSDRLGQGNLVPLASIASDFPQRAEHQSMSRTNCCLLHSLRGADERRPTGKRGSRRRKNTWLSLYKLLIYKSIQTKDCVLLIILFQQLLCFEEMPNKAARSFKYPWFLKCGAGSCYWTLLQSFI